MGGVSRQLICQGAEYQVVYPLTTGHANVARSHCTPANYVEHNKGTVLIVACSGHAIPAYKWIIEEGCNVDSLNFTKADTITTVLTSGGTGKYVRDSRIGLPIARLRLIRERSFSV